jgi:uncharacterized membrane protein
MRPSRSAQQAPAPAIMVHLYRGLMDRAVTWRARIDTPTNWAITITGTASSFALSDLQHHHATVLLTIVFCIGFWFIESRRFRYYDLWATWVRLLETDFYAPLLGQNTLAVDQYWHKLLICDMTTPHFKVTPLEALGRRLRHNYMAIFIFLLFVWFLKLMIHPQIEGQSRLSTFVYDAALGPFSGKLVILGVLGFYAMLFVLALTTLPRWKGRTEMVSHERALRKLALPTAQPVGRRWHRRRSRSRYGKAQD